MRLPWERYDQSQESNLMSWRLKINHSVKVPLRRRSIGVVLSIEYLYSTFVLKQLEIKKIQGLPQNNNNEIKPVPGVPEI